MSPQTSRYPTPAPGDAAQPSGGRHRRPESLADAPRGRPPANEVPAYRLGSYRAGSGERGFDQPAPGRTGYATPSGGSGAGWSTAAEEPGGPGIVSVGGGTALRAARHQRNARTGRHAAEARAANRPPVIGSHRAPGTLPLESWLLLGKTRQRALLASLVAVGLLLLAVPAEQRQEGVDAVNAAAKRAAAVSGVKTRPPETPAPTGGGGEQKADDPAPAPTASAKAPPVVPVKPTASPAEKNDDLGPGRSLRTTGSRAIALTFDDGPDPVQTPRLLAMLDSHQVRATFCLVGEQVEKHPEIVQQIAAAGHALCNHTWSHSLTIGKDKPEQIRADLERTNDAIRAAVPGAEIPFFRAPGGNFTERLVDVATGTEMTSLYWEVDPRDWERPPGETSAAHVRRLISEVRTNLRPGAIVLSHDFNQPDTIAAYEKLLPWLTERFTIGIPGRPAPEASAPPATAPPTPDGPPATATPTATTAP
jgi:peptidoglycan-N-acetylglucosamine deacetylase